MGITQRTRLLAAVFCVSAAALSYTSNSTQRAQVATPPTQFVIDDGEPGFTAGAFSTTAYPQGYKGDTAYHAAVLTKPQPKVYPEASWTFSNVPKGAYYIYATWGANATFSKEAKYSYSAAGKVWASSIKKNQTIAPKGVTVGGTTWQLIGVVSISKDNDLIKLSVAASEKGYTVADAAMLVKVGTKPVIPFCGNKTVEGAEQCDDGNIVNGDGCSAACIKEAANCPTPVCAAAPAGCTYVADPTIGANGCLANPCGTLSCPVVPSCGNAAIDADEQCDDGNTKPGDGCSTMCQTESCGDKVVTPSHGEECDNGMQDIPMTDSAPYVGCARDCKLVYCGDRIIQSYLQEQCDDGNRLTGDGCDASCKVEVPKVACNNGTDDDGDGTIDLADAGCSNAQDTNEADGDADVGITMTVVPGPIPMDSAYGVTVSVINNGPDAAVARDVTLSLPDKTTYEPQNSDSRCSEQSGIIRCNLGALAVGATHTLNLTYHVRPAVSCQEAIVHNALIATTPQMDPITSNNLATASETILCPTSNLSLDLQIDGPVQQVFTRDDDDAVLANLVISTDGVVDIRDLYVAIEGKTSQNFGLGPNSPIANVLEDVELRNTRDGQTITATRLTTQGNSGIGDFFSDDAETWQIYHFKDFEVSGQQTWELQVDFIDNGTTTHPMNGDIFRMHACTTVDVATCPFGGLITATDDYNLRAEDGTGLSVTNVTPGGTISGNFQRIATPELNVAVKSIGLMDTATTNSRNVNLLRFEARPNDADDVLFTHAIFQATAGSLQNAQNYTLWFDSDGDGVVDTPAQTGVSIWNGLVTFDDLTGGGILVPRETSVLFEVHADIASSLTSNTLQLAFATGNYIEAEEADNGSSLIGIMTNGVCSTSKCEIIVTTVPSKIFTLVRGGDLFVTLDSAPTRNRQLLAGVLGEAILRLQFRAQNEDIDVTDIQFYAGSASLATSLERLELYMDGAVSAFATATVSGCGSDQVAPGTFCANMENGQLIIPNGQNLDVLVKPRMKSDEQGAISGQRIQLYVLPLAVSDNATGRGAVRARGRQSSTNLNANDGDNIAESEVFIGADTPMWNNAIRGNMNATVLSKITTIANANFDADNTNIPTGVSPFGQFRFTAANNSNTLNGLNKATLGDVIFTVNATNMWFDGTSFKMYNKADTSVKATCVAKNSAGTVVTGTSVTGLLYIECRNLKSSTVDTQLESGETSTFVLEANITNSKVSIIMNSSLQASIDSFTEITKTSLGLFPNNSHIHWFDEDTTSTEFYWIEYFDTVVRSTLYRS